MILLLVWLCIWTLDKIILFCPSCMLISLLHVPINDSWHKNALDSSLSGLKYQLVPVWSFVNLSTDIGHWTWIKKLIEVQEKYVITTMIRVKENVNITPWIQIHWIIAFVSCLSYHTIYIIYNEIEEFHDSSIVQTTLFDSNVTANTTLHTPILRSHKHEWHK